MNVGEQHGCCEACRWWSPPTDDDRQFGENPWYGRCQRIPHAGDRDRGVIGALAEDVEGYHAWLRTLPTFGCVLWEPTA